MVHSSITEMMSFFFLFSFFFSSLFCRSDTIVQGGATALFTAAQMGHASTVSLLLHRGADPNIKTEVSVLLLFLSSSGAHPIVGSMYSFICGICRRLYRNTKAFNSIWCRCKRKNKSFYSPFLINAHLQYLHSHPILSPFFI